MIPFRQLLMILVLLPWLVCGCAGPSSALAPHPAGPVKIVISGTPGSSFSGYRVVDGVRSRLAGKVPLELTQTGLSQIVLVKERSEDELTLHAKYDNGSIQMGLPPGRADALLVVLEGGSSGSYVPADKLKSLAENALIVLKPYWFEGTWVFDDEDVGLRREPFIAGVPEMIDEVVKDLPSARRGFRLTCSEHEFPGFQKKLIWVRAERGGNFYRLDRTKMEGWLCPAMFRYFNHAPERLYVRVDAIER